MILYVFLTYPSTYFVLYMIYTVKCQICNVLVIYNCHIFMYQNSFEHCRDKFNLVALVFKFSKFVGALQRQVQLNSIILQIFINQNSLEHCGDKFNLIALFFKFFKLVELVPACSSNFVRWKSRISRISKKSRISRKSRINIVWYLLFKGTVNVISSDPPFLVWFMSNFLKGINIPPWTSRPALLIYVNFFN